MFEWMNKTFRNAVSVLLIAAFGVIPPVAAQTVPITQDAQPVNEGNNPTVERRVAFGSWIFGGEFANQSFIGFNPNYEIAIGDRIALQLGVVLTSQVTWLWTRRAMCLSLKLAQLKFRA